MRAKKLSTLIILLFTAAFAHAATRLVPAQYPNIQAAIDDCNHGDEVIASEGTYYENLLFRGKNITLRSTNPEDPNVVAATVIDGNGVDRVIRYVGTETADCLLSGFTITGGIAKDGGGIAGSNSTGTITHCIITGNTANKNGGGLFLCNGLISNCLISNNTATDYGSGINNCAGVIRNCIITGNSTIITYGNALHYCNGSIQNCVITRNRRTGLGWCENTLVMNCTIAENGKYGMERCTGELINNIVYNNTGGEMYLCSTPTHPYFLDPKFVDPNNGDYHLGANSPCIDAGKNTWPIPMPKSDLDGNSRQIDGDGDGRVTVDIGAYEYGVVETSLISAQPEQFEFMVIQGQPNPQPKILFISNVGLDSIAWEIAKDCSWLFVFPESGSSAGEIEEVSLYVDHTAMPPGRHVCDLAIRDNTSSNSPVVVPVTLVVHSEGLLRVPSEFLTIQDAVDNAEEGDVVTVADGTYTGYGNRGIDFGGKFLTVRSENGPEGCIIDCNYCSRGFYFHSGEDVNSLVDGFSIVNGYADYGAGIYCRDSSPTILNCIITDNIAKYAGSGISCWDSSLRVNNCIISDNFVQHNNSACAIQLASGDEMITNSEISGNYGGGSAGIGIYDSAIVRNCNIRNNEGQGIQLVCSDYPSIENCIISGNLGGIYLLGNGSRCTTLNPKITNCVITGNRFYGLYWTEEYHNDYPAPFVENCIISDNLNYQVVDDFNALTMVYSNVAGGWPGVGNIDADPCFVEPGYWDPKGTLADANDDFWVDGDYHLKSRGWRWDAGRRTWTWDTVTSRCIDAGDPDAPLRDEPLFVPVDPTGYWGANLRINMGAYGGTAEASIPPHGWAIRTDYNNDGILNFTDFAYWSPYANTASQWGSDHNYNCTDLVILAESWLNQTDWFKTPSPGIPFHIPVPGQASGPNPPDGAVGIRLDPVLGWEAGAGATSHDVYFCTPDPPTFQASTTATTFVPGYLSLNTTYYWRIDEVNPFGRTASPVWTFTTGTGGGGR